MSTFTRLSLLLALASVADLAGCGPKEPTVAALSEEEAVDPTKQFHKGLEFLQSAPQSSAPDAQYQAAYDSFTKAADLADAQGNKSIAVKAHYNAAWTAETMGRIPEAEKHYKAAYEKDPTYEKAMFSLSRIYVQGGKHNENVALYRAYVESHPNDNVAKNDLIAALTEAKMYDDAIAESEAVLRNDPENADAYRNLSALYYSKGEYGMSQLCAEKALALKDTDPGVYNNMGVTYLIQKDEAAAIEKFKQAVKIDPKNYEANTNLGYVALNSGDYSLAKTSFESALQSNPGSVDAKIGLAVALRGNKEYKEAGDLYDTIIRAEPDNKLAYFNAAILHEKYTKDFNKALKILQSYVDTHAGQISPSDPVFTRIEEIKAAKARFEEEERLRKQKEAEEIARKKRNEELLKSVANDISALRGEVDKNASCLGEDVVMELGMYLDQGNEVVAAGDAAMAPDIQSLINDFVRPQLTEYLGSLCGIAPAGDEGGGDGGTPEAPPTEGGGQ
jgi:tetratricopeptide (TPR) repeat protein